MSMIDSHDVICDNCGNPHTVISYGEFECPHCGKRWIIEIREKVTSDPRNRKRKMCSVGIYMNGCSYNDKAPLHT